MEKAIDVHHSYAKHMACLTADDALAKMHAMLSKNLLGNTSGILPEPTMKPLLAPVSGLNAFMSTSACSAAKTSCLV